MNQLDETYWDNRYINKEIAWDLGEISPPLKAYINQLEDKSVRILIPGGGHSYEAEYLFNKGFQNVFVVDVSKTALNTVSSRIPKFPKSHLLHANFFDLEQTFDLIFEQTFFCALHPSQRPKYALKMCELLSPKAKLVGVMFSIPLYNEHPPFGGNKEEYIQYFNPYFEIEIMEPCYNSIKERQGKELFIKLIKN